MEISPSGNNQVVTILSRTQNMLLIKFNELLCAVKQSTNAVVVYTKCYQNNIGRFTKVLLSDGTIYWFDSSDALLASAPAGVTPCTDVQVQVQVVCLSNDNGETIVSGTEVFLVDELGNVSSKIYLDGVDVSATYKVVPCGVKVKYDYETSEVCVDGKSWTKIQIFDPSSGTPQYVTTIWMDENEVVQPTPSASLINNANCNIVILPTPSISDALGDDLSTLLDSHSFSISKPECCTILVNTSIGSFRVVKGTVAYSTTQYDAPFKINIISIVSGNCSLSNIHVIGNKIK
jgi:hypothetical protein